MPELTLKGGIAIYRENIHRQGCGHIGRLGFILYSLWLQSLSRIVVDIGLPNHKWHIIPKYPMSANQSITA